MANPLITIPDRIIEIENVEVVFALKRLCTYLVETAWVTDTLDDEFGAELKLAMVRSKKYENEILSLSRLDADLGWGEKKHQRGRGFIITKEGNFNPWYHGDCSLTQLLSSLDSLVEVLVSIDPTSFADAEFLHYYFYLNGLLPPKSKGPERLTFYNLHPKVKVASGSLVRSKHYAQAVLEAYKAVFNEVKQVSGVYDSDGEKLVGKVFNVKTPIIALNDLKTLSDKDEQRGFMLLLQGANAGIRNPKAHDLTTLSDERRTLEYLWFASFLLERIDERFLPVKSLNFNQEQE